MQSAEQFRKNMFSESELLYSNGTLDTGRIDELLEAFANVRRQSPPSCLMCGNMGEVAIKHEPSGVWICMKCRDGQSELTELRAKVARYEALEAHLPPGFAIGDDATAELAIKLVAAEAEAAALKRDYAHLDFLFTDLEEHANDLKFEAAALRERERKGLTFRDAGEG